MSGGGNPLDQAGLPFGVPVESVEEGDFPIGSPAEQAEPAETQAPQTYLTSVPEDVSFPIGEAPQVWDGAGSCDNQGEVEPMDATTLEKYMYYPDLNFDFQEAEACLNKTGSQVDLVNLITDEGATWYGEAPKAEHTKSSDELDADLMELMDFVVPECDTPDKFSIRVELVSEPSLPATFGGLSLSGGPSAEATDHLPILSVLHQQPQQPAAEASSRRAVNLPLSVNQFEIDEPPPSVKTELVSAIPAARTGSFKSGSFARRRDPVDSSGCPDKSYESVCRKNRIFDSAAKAKYNMPADMGRDAIIDKIVDYIKLCIDTERDRVHRFLMVILVDGLLERGPHWQFFKEAVYFCDSRKQRQSGNPCVMFHINLSAYVGVLWAKFKGNECFDYATLGDAIKSVKSKPNGDDFFVDPDFGASKGKPKRLFQFGGVAMEEIRRYHNNRLSNDKAAAC